MFWHSKGQRDLEDRISNLRVALADVDREVVKLKADKERLTTCLSIAEANNNTMKTELAEAKEVAIKCRDFYVVIAQLFVTTGEALEALPDFPPLED